MARRDRLTGLHTSEALEDVAARFRSEADGAVWTAAKIDLDHLGLVNSVYGRFTGDSILQLLGGILRAHSEDDLLTLRSGEDEFLVFFPGLTKMEAVSFGHKVYEDLSMASFPHSISVSVSMGFADTGDGAGSIADLMTLAGKSLERAKNSGRGRIHLFSEKRDALDSRPRFDHFVDRQFELGMLMNALDDAHRGNSELVVISGEPGVGKTRLLEEFLRRAVFRGFLTAGVRFGRTGAVESYRSLSETVAMTGDAMSGDEAARLLALLEDAPVSLEEAAPWLRSHSRRMSPPELEGIDRSAIDASIIEMIRRITAIRPLILYFEDIQWITSETLELLGRIARSMTGNRLLIAATTRSVGKDSEAGRYLRVLSVMVNMLSIELGSFSERFTTHMTTLALRNISVTDEFIRSVHRETQGNPLHIRELISKLHHEGTLVEVAGGRGAPGGLKDADDAGDPSRVIAFRVEGLDRISAQLLEIGSMTRSSFSFELLRTVAGLDGLEVAVSLDALIEEGLVVEEHGTGGNVAFGLSHEMLRESVMAGLTQAKREILDLRLARYYESRAEGGDASAVPLAADHYSRTREHPKARYFALLSAKRARAAGSRDEAKWLEVFMDHTETDMPPSNDAFSILARLGRLLTFGKDVHRGMEYLERAESIARTDRERGEIQFLMGNNFTFRGMSDKGREHYLKALDYPLAPSDRNNVYLKLAYGGYTSGMLDEVRKYASIFRRSCSDGAEEKEMCVAEALVLEGLLAASEGDPEGACSKFEEAAEIKERFEGLSPGVHVLFMNIGCSYFDRGYTGRGMEYITRARTGLETLGDTVSLGFVYSNLAAEYRTVGDTDSARFFAERCLALSEASGHMQSAPSAHLVLARLAHDEGDLDRSLELLKEARRISREAHHAEEERAAALMTARCLVGRGDIEGASVTLSEYLDMMDDETEEEPEYLMISALTLPRGGGENATKRLDLLRRAWSLAGDRLASSCAHIASALVDELRERGLAEEALRTRSAFRERIMAQHDRIDDGEMQRRFLSRGVFAPFLDNANGG